MVDFTAMAPTGNTWRMADRLVEGRLIDLLTAYRGEAQSFEQIARRLYDDGGVEVSAETIRKWVAELGIEAVA